MTYIDKYKHTCPKCGKSYYRDVYHRIDVKEDPDLKEKVLDGEIFEMTCPHCHKEEIEYYPFTYCDVDHNFVVFFGPYSNLLDVREDLIEDDKWEDIMEDLPKDITTVGATELFELKSVITSLEEGLDWRVIQIHCLVAEQRLIELSVKKKEKLHIYNSYLTRDKKKNNRLVIAINCKINGKRNTTFYTFEKEEYEALCEQFKERLDLIDPFIFNNTARADFLQFFEEDFNVHQEHMNTYYYVKDSESGMIFVCGVVGCLSNLKADDGVIYDTNHSRRTGYIKRIVNKNQLCMSVDKFFQGSIVSVLRDSNIDRLPLEEQTTDQEELLKELEDINGHNMVKLASLLKHTNVYLCLRKTGERGESVDEQVMKFQKVDIDDKMYIAIYTDEFYLPKESEGFIVEPFSFDSVVRMVKYNTRLDGIVVNQYDNRIILDFKFLKKYIAYSALGTPKAFMNLLMDLTPAEKEFIKERPYQIAVDIHINNLNDEEIFSKYKVTPKRLKTVLDRVVFCLDKIAFARF